MQHHKIGQGNLKYEYSWTHTVNDNPHKRELDSHKFNREEGYEVLYLLNSLPGVVDTDAPRSIGNFRIYEIMIHEYLPSKIRRTKDVEEWLTHSFPEYSERILKNYPLGLF